MCDEIDKHFEYVKELEERLEEIKQWCDEQCSFRRKIDEIQRIVRGKRDGSPR